MQLGFVLVASVCSAQRQSQSKRPSDQPSSSAATDLSPSAASRTQPEATRDSPGARTSSDSSEASPTDVSSSGGWVTPYPNTSAPPLVPADASSYASGASESGPDPALTPVLIKAPERPVRIGLLVGIISIPRLLSFELFAKVHNLFGIGVGYNLLPSPVGDWLLSIGGVHNASVESSAWDIDLRLFVLRGSFFVGTSFGRQGVSASADVNTNTLFGRVHFTGDLSSFYVTPRLGWLWIWRSGFSLGLDAGVQFPIAYDLTLGPAIIFNDPTLRNDPTMRRYVKDVEDAAKLVGETPLPSINFRIGYTY